MLKQTLLYVTVIAVLVGGATAVYLYLLSPVDSEPVSSDLQKPTLNSSSENSQNASSDLSVMGSQSKLDTSQIISQTQPNDQNQSGATLPSPSEFSIYEEYSANDTALYIDITAGDGREAQSGDSVAVVYSGWLTNGELFDQSNVNEQNQIEPFIFQLGSRQVIPGWEQSIIGLKEGGSRRLIIPSSLGYGENGQGPIPPNAMLIFDVQLLELSRP